MKKVYIETISGLPHIPLLFPNLGVINRPERLFSNTTLQSLSSPIIQITENPNEADYHLIPHDFFRVVEKTDYLARVSLRAKECGKKILIFDYSDYDNPINVENSIIFRTSEYRYKQASNVHIMPPFVEDLGREVGVVLRTKRDKPVVGFCGWADFDSWQRKLRYVIRLALVEVQSLVRGARVRAHKSGLYFRRTAISALKSSPLLVESNFLIRKTFSAHAHSIDSDPVLARREYVENMKNSDFILSPKGDGNYSMRFYEALSLGRVPLLIDTETVLPLEREIDYNSFVLRVSFADIRRLPEIVSDFYSSLSEEEFKHMQEKARSAFVEKLSGEAFLRHIFLKLL